MTDTVLETPAAPEPVDTTDSAQLEAYRRELTGYCYRMLGSPFDADDAVQETMVRAWKGLAKFENRSGLRSWLYRIATNVCLDSLSGAKRRAMPMDVEATASPPVLESLGTPLPAGTWVEPILDSHVLTADPADVAVGRETIRLAFVAALQYLPPRQRSVLILRDVLRWKADEVAELLDTTTASANSALQRARATLAARGVETEPAQDPLDGELAALLERYVEAFEAYDMPALVRLLHEDATQSMPPFSLWLQGSADIVAWMVGVGKECRGSRLVPLDVNGTRGFAQYKPSGPGGRHEPWAIQALDIRDGAVVGMTFFLGKDLFERFSLPPHLD